MVLLWRSLALLYPKAKGSKAAQALESASAIQEFVESQRKRQQEALTQDGSGSESGNESASATPVLKKPGALVLKKPAAPQRKDRMKDHQWKRLGATWGHPERGIGCLQALGQERAEEHRE